MRQLGDALKVLRLFSLKKQSNGFILTKLHFFG